MTLPTKCSKCGAPLGFTPGAGGQRLCLSCLLGFGLRSNWGPEEGEPKAEAGRDPQLGTLPEELGRYRLLEKIGEGGCGVVYRAEQLEPVRRLVAIKVIKLGMDSRTVSARFEQERQALALMEHPGIAQVFDGGTTSTGRPYFVMELVAGEPLTTYCHNRQLNLAQRLRLFVELCQAVQHAHQKGIIHRDLKPSNVLVAEVNGVPHPKVIDFGVARAISRQRLGGDTLYTAFDQFVGTPAYMSPEQAGLSADAVDTRSDIYSLGVLLYELLTESPPFEPLRLRQAALDEVCRIIRTEEPARPSTRVRRNLQAGASASPQRPGLPADLDWIVMKALEKEPARRYETASAFALDLERHLADEPVSARPPSGAYRLGKFFRRHRAAALAAGLLSLALLAGTFVSAVLAVRAHRAEENERALRAQAQAAAVQARAEAVAGERVLSLLNTTYSAWRPPAGRRRHTLAWTSVIESLRQRTQTNRVEALQPPLERLTALMLLADHAAWGGDLAAAETLLHEGLQLTEGLGTAPDPLRAGVLECLALVLRRAGRAEEAGRTFAEALAWRQRSQPTDPTALRASYAFAYACSQARQRGDWAQAEQLGQLHVAALRQSYGATNLALAQALLDLGKAFSSDNKLPEAGAVYSEAVAILRALPSLANDPELPELCQDITNSFALVAGHLRRVGQAAQAAQLPAEAAELVRRLQDPSAPTGPAAAK